MTDVTFDDLIEIYRSTRFDDAGGGTLTVSSERIVETLNIIMNDDALYNDAQITVDGSDDPVLGNDIAISVGAPNSVKMGLLASNYTDFFQSPGALLAEPERYYIKNPGFASGDQPVPDVIIRYRSVIQVIAILKECAAVFNETMRQLVFLDKDKVVVTISFTPNDLKGDVVTKADRLKRLFEHELHIDERRDLLQTTLVEMAGALHPSTRFGYIIRNLDRLCDDVEKGYKLFLSSFSYSKIRNDVETARLDFIGKIHKTIVDIQGQLLGIPIATIVVGSQLKQSKGCDMALWANLGVLIGSWIFVSMLFISVINQWKTLISIGNEIDRQKTRLVDDFETVADQFLDIFNDLADRMNWHKNALVFISAVLGTGALSTTAIFFHLAPKGLGNCMAFWQ